MHQLPPQMRASVDRNNPLVGRADRQIGLDALRGFAMVWMTLFHLGFDLATLGFWQQNFYTDPVWTWQRSAIVSLFLLCAGMGQGLAQGQSWARFWRRWLQIVACAAAVSVGSWIMFPNSFIYFGVLHGMAVMLVVARLSSGLGAWLWPIGASLIAMYFVASKAINALATIDFLNEKPWNVLGLISRKPVTEDYVPVLPWLGVMLWGVALGPHVAWCLNAAVLTRWAAARWLAALGRWSLSYYMVHQPVLIGVLSAYRWCVG